MAAAGHSPGPCACLFDRLGPGPLVIAHRGDRARRPENTLCAFRACLGRSPMIELDVRLAADGAVVVFHDHYLTRTSDALRLRPIVGASSLLVRDWRLDQLLRLDVGSWFLDADPFGSLRSGRADRLVLQTLMPQRIPTLDEVLAWAVRCCLPLNVELKDEHHPRANDRLASAVIGRVRAAGAGRLVVLSSFNHAVLRRCRDLAPEIAIAALAERSHPPDLVGWLRSLGACAYHPADALVDQPLIRLLLTAGFRVNVFTVNDPARRRELFAWGASGVFTDWVDSA